MADEIRSGIGAHADQISGDHSSGYRLHKGRGQIRTACHKVLCQTCTQIDEIAGHGGARLCHCRYGIGLVGECRDGEQAHDGADSQQPAEELVFHLCHENPPLRKNDGLRPLSGTFGKPSFPAVWKGIRDWKKIPE